MMDHSRKYVQCGGIVFREEEDGAFVFDPETGNLKYMNRSGRETYLMLDGKSDLDRVISNLSEIYAEVDLNQLRRDVEVFVTELEDGGFISCLNENAPARGI